MVQSSAEKDELMHYASELYNGELGKETGKAVIRGHKLYWHKGNVGRDQIRERDLDKMTKAKLQYTDIKPIKAGVCFDFTIHFENLSDVELGALLWVLSISGDKSQELGIAEEGKQYRLSLGMGKPLGMGAVKISHELHLSNRQQRYEKLFDDRYWFTGEAAVSTIKHNAFIKAFEEYVLDHISLFDYPIGKTREQLEHLQVLPRIQMLLAMLSWSDPVSSLKIEHPTRYMEIERDTSKQYVGKRVDERKVKKKNEYAERLVLPTPLQVMDIPDNRWFDHSIALPASTEGANEKPKKKTAPSRTDSHKGQSEGGGGTNPVFARPKPPKR